MSDERRVTSLERHNCVVVEFKLIGGLYSGVGDGTRRQEQDALGSRTELLFYKERQLCIGGSEFRIWH
jgi:hypothetical protein